jgi:hypothetical protein
VERIDVEWFEQQMFDAAVTGLRAWGDQPVPTCHMFGRDHTTLPYLGYAACRPYHSQRDAVDALTELGDAAACAGADRLVWVWENRVLHAAVAASLHYPLMIVTCDVPREGQHVATAHPYRETPTPPSLRGRVYPHFYCPPLVWPGIVLPPGVAHAVARWRVLSPEPRLAPLRLLGQRMADAGYTFAWTELAPL